MPAALLALFDQPGLAEDRHVLGDGGRREAKHIDDLAEAEFAVAEHGECAHAAVIAHRLGDGDEFTERVSSLIRHLSKCRRPAADRQHRASFCDTC